MGQLEVADDVHSVVASCRRQRRISRGGLGSRGKEIGAVIEKRCATGDDSDETMAMAVVKAGLSHCRDGAVARCGRQKKGL